MKKSTTKRLAKSRLIFFSALLVISCCHVRPKNVTALETGGYVYQMEDLPFPSHFKEVPSGGLVEFSNGQRRVKVVFSGTVPLEITTKWVEKAMKEKKWKNISTENVGNSQEFVYQKRQDKLTLGVTKDPDQDETIIEYRLN